MTTPEDFQVKRLGWEDCPLVMRMPGRVSGQWTFGNTRLPLSAVFDNLAGGCTIKEITEEIYPGLTEDEVKGVLAHVADMLRQDGLSLDGTPVLLPLQ